VEAAEGWAVLAGGRDAAGGTRDGRSSGGLRRRDQSRPALVTATQRFGGSPRIKISDEPVLREIWLRVCAREEMDGT
jgi:hypothetical protein